MPPISSTLVNPDLAQKIREAQALFFDKAANYMRLVVGLGYGGFFAVWAGTKPYLSPKYVVLSALSMLLSAVLFIAYEVVEAGTVSHLNLRLARTTNSTGDLSAADAERFLRSIDRVRRIFPKVWLPVFYACVITGFGGAVVLVCGFVRSLWTLR